MGILCIDAKPKKYRRRHGDKAARKRAQKKERKTQRLREQSPPPPLYTVLTNIVKEYAGHKTVKVFVPKLGKVLLYNKHTWKGKPTEQGVVYYASKNGKVSITLQRCLVPKQGYVPMWRLEHRYSKLKGCKTPNYCR